MLTRPRRRPRLARPLDIGNAEPDLYLRANGTYALAHVLENVSVGPPGGPPRVLGWVGRTSLRQSRVFGSVDEESAQVVRLLVSVRARMAGVDESTLRLIRTWALNVAAQATALARAESAWRSEAHPVGDGWLILWGRDMYVNRAMAVGIAGEVSNDDLDFIVTRCQRMGVQPAFEVTPLTLPETVERLDRHGFVHDTSANVTALVRPMPGPPIDGSADFVVRPVRGEADLVLWQEVNATGWGHADRRARDVSDAFARAAYVTDGDGMMIAFDGNGERPVGCASVTIRDGLATLGAMSTHPDHRRRGVQAALVHHRLLLAAQRGCDRASTTAAAGGRSERNLRRHGFRPLFEIEIWKA